MSAVDLTGIITELRLQGWELTLKGDGSEWRAVPPNKSGRIVHFNARPTSPIPVLRDLRHQGFVWPPKSNGHSNGHDEEPEPQVRSTPFPPKPNPETSTEAQSNHEEEQQAQDATALAFVQLREAKEYERLAAAELIKCSAELEAVKRKAAKVTSTYEEALRGLKEAKQAFDRVFETDVPGGGT